MNKRRILIVDDDQFVRQSIAELLKAWEDYDPIQAGNATDGFTRQMTRI